MTVATGGHTPGVSSGHPSLVTLEKVMYIGIGTIILIIILVLLLT